MLAIRASQCRSGLSPVVRDRQARSLGQAGKSCGLLGGFQFESLTTDFQAAQRCFERLNDFTAGDSLDAQVDAVDLVRRATPIELRIRGLDLYYHKPTIRSAGDRCAQNLAREAQFLGHSDFADLGQTDRLAIQGELVVGNIKAVAAFLKPWFVRFFALLEIGKEPFPCFGEIPERLGVGIPVNVFQPRPTVSHCGSVYLMALNCFLSAMAFGLPPAAHCLFHSLSANAPRRAAGALEVVHLLRRRTKSDLVV